MVTVLALLGVLGVLFVAAVLATRDGPILADAPPDLADLALPQGPVTAGDVSRLRFSLAPRGYRMSEVDLVLGRLADELAERDRRIAQLESGQEGVRADAGAGAAGTAATETTPTGAAEAAASEPPRPVPPSAPRVVPPAPAAAVAPAPVAAPGVAPPATEPASGTPSGPTAADASSGTSPASAPAADPLPAADLGSELVTEERVEQAQRGGNQQP